MARFRLGLIINPLAGVGGPAALKGSDGVAEQALAMGFEAKAAQRVQLALEPLRKMADELEFVTCAGAMGAEVLAQMGFSQQVVLSDVQMPSSAVDTQRAVKAIEAAGVDLLLFAGGDGTARDVCAVVSAHQPVLGIPAGVKIQSGVYAISPRAAGELVVRLLEGGLVRLAAGEVRDIDENALRQGQVKSRWYGELCVPQESGFVQAVKQGGVESEELVLLELSQWLERDLEEGVRYVFGPGSTLYGLAQNLGLSTTLLGVDVIENGQVIARDVTEKELFALVSDHPAFILLTAIGGQGHILGRGNQQISPRVVRAVGLDRLRVVATKRKLSTLDGRSLLLDSGDPALDQQLAGAIRVWVGYQEELLYPLKA